MSVTLQFNVTQSSNRKYITFNETTNSYSSVNTGGWGAPNETTANATTATLAITTPAAQTFTLNLFTSSFPTTNPLQNYIILPENIGYTANTPLPDGNYIFVYKTLTVAQPVNGYTQTLNTEIFGTLQCQVFTSYANIPDEDCGSCVSDAVDLSLKGTIFLHALEYAASAGQTTTFANLQTILNNLLLNQNCQDC